MSTPSHSQGTKRGRATNPMHKYFKRVEAGASNVLLFSSPSTARNHEVPVVIFEPEEVEGTQRTDEVQGVQSTDFEEVEGAQRTDQVEGVQRTDFEEVENTRRADLEELDTRSVPEVADSVDVTSLERDPGLRIPIMQYPANKRDEVRRAYLQMGRIRVKLAKYPGTPMGVQDRRFAAKWFDEFHWLEYSKAKDAVFCFYCYLFEKNPPRRPEYTCEGFRNWHNVKNGAKCSFLAHMGGHKSVHFTSVEAGENLRNPQQHISTIMHTQSVEIIRRNRLRFTISVRCALWLAFQQCPFRGHDESKNSKNRGNFLEMVRFSSTLNDKVKEVVLENDPKNATYTSPSIQKEILNIVSNEIRDKIREEIGDRKYCILVDESKDASDKEQMVLVLRYVDSDGYVQERFFDIQRVKNTCAVTLKKGITDILNRYNLPIENMRGQGYDGANNMRGRVNGLKALFLKDCEYAYYVHCFAHRLQLALVHTAEKNSNLWDFFSMLNNIVNLVTASPLRLGSFQDAQEDDINQRLADGDIETGKGANQIGTLPRANDTRWSSHYGSVCSLIDKFDAAYTTIEDISTSDPNETCGVGQAQSTLEKMQEFKFVFMLHLVYKIMGYTEILCQGLQKKTQDIVNAVALVSNTKLLLHKLRSDEDGYRLFIGTVCLFCVEHGIDIPDMTAPYIQGTGRSCQQRDNITVDHHYHYDIFNAAIDLQITELVGRFPEDTMELLVLCSCLDPRESFKAFNVDNLCTLAKKFYPMDFSRQEVHTLRNELYHYGEDVVKHAGFKNLSTVAELCRRLVETRKAEVYPLVDRLIRLILTLPVSTASAERYFSTMSNVKSALRNKMEANFLRDCMMINIESILARKISINRIIDLFIARKDRKVKLKE